MDRVIITCRDRRRLWSAQTDGWTARRKQRTHPEHFRGDTPRAITLGRSHLKTKTLDLAIMRPPYDQPLREALTHRASEIAKEIWSR